jgi:hypothetical protein
MVCVDFWEQRCDARQVTLRLLFADGAEAHWHAKRPFWCQSSGCLLSLFGQDMRHFACQHQ